MANSYSIPGLRPHDLTSTSNPCTNRVDAILILNRSSRNFRVSSGMQFANRQLSLSLTGSKQLPPNSIKSVYLRASNHSFSGNLRPLPISLPESNHFCHVKRLSSRRKKTLLKSFPYQTSANLLGFLGPSKAVEVIEKTGLKLYDIAGMEAANTLNFLKQKSGNLNIDVAKTFENGYSTLEKIFTIQGIFGNTNPIDALKFINSSPVKVAEDLPNLIPSTFSELQEMGIATLTQTSLSAASGVNTAVNTISSSPSLARLGHSATSAIQEAEALSDHINSQVGNLASDIVNNPSFISSATQYLTNEIVSNLSNSAEIALKTPGASAVLAGIAGAAIGTVIGNLTVAISEGKFSKGDEIPMRYDPEGIAAYFQRRPFKVLSRFAYIFSEISVFISNIYFDRANGKEKENERMRARQLVDLIARMGPTSIKVGQALSIRPDLLSVAYLEELQTLQDKVPPFSNEEAKQLILEGLGKPCDSFFSEFSSEPIAAASLGQVYKAKVKDTGETVAVKVQRPDVLEGIACDLFVLRIIAKLLKYLPNSHTDFVDLLDTWARRFFDELDYVQEAKNAERFANDMKILKNVTVPTVFMDLTSRKVLTSGWIEGEKLSESKADDLGGLVTTALNCYLIQLLETGFLHADPHPGNLLRTPDGKLCILDYGLMTEVTLNQQYALIEYISHIVNADFEKVAEDLVVLGFVPPELVDPEKTAAVVPQLSRVLGQLTQGGGARKINIAQVTDDLTKIAQDYVFVIPSYFALILRAFSVLEGIGLKNDPDYAIVDECYPYISKRLITDDSPRARIALKYFLYGNNDRLDVSRVEELSAGFQSFRELMTPSEQLEPSNSLISKKRLNVDPSAKQALMLVFAPEGSFIQELLLTELVRAVDAMSREAMAELWSFFVSRSSFPIPASLSTPGSWPLPIPGMVAGIIRGSWAMGKLTEEDQQSLSTVRRLWVILEPQFGNSYSQFSPSDAAEAARDAYPLVRDLLPGLTTATQRFIVMLLQRQALRLADELDGKNSISEWEKDPAATARQIKPLQIFRRRVASPSPSLSPSSSPKSQSEPESDRKLLTA